MGKHITIYEKNNMIAADYYDGVTTHCMGDVRKNSQNHLEFFKGCANLLDELLKKFDEPFEGRAVCIASDNERFKVGRIYHWIDGRMLDEHGEISPKECKLYSFDEIKNDKLKFIKIVE